MAHPFLKVASEDTREDLEQLVTAVQNGNEAAFAPLVEKSQTRLFRLFLYLTGNRQLAEDLTQDTFIRAFEKLKTLRDPKTFQAWLHQMGRNVFLAHIRLHKNTKTLSSDKLPDGADTRQDASLTGLSHDIHKALNTLEAEDRWLVLLVDYEENSYGEAARIMGISEAAARSRLHRARKKLVEYFELS